VKNASECSFQEIGQLNNLSICQDTSKELVESSTPSFIVGEQENNPR
jgi:hypothetical protein